MVSVAQTGEKALELYERYGARVIVLDIMLPGMDLGADDYIEKSYDVDILIAKIK